MTRIFDMVRAPPETPMRKLSSISRRRFDYVRMTGAELEDDLAAIDMQASAFCRIFGANGETMKKWMRDDQEIPPWVPVALALLKAGPHMTVIARGEAAARIKFDHDFPDRGEFPYEKNREDSE